ncbi:arylesterase [Marinicella sp. W31]|uniref:arylesterase n=1 Tax=Marinicella sp. W31 TaxID=3023713 RepID=UPI0037569F66
MTLAACQSEQSASKNTPQAKTTTETAPQLQQGPVILALGDSLTEGLGVPRDQNYPAQLQALLKDEGYGHYRVTNAGLSGETSNGLKNRLNWVLKSKPAITILTIGGNDAMRGLPIDLTEKNVQTIIETVQASGSQIVLGGMQIYENLGAEYVQEFQNIFPRLAEKYDIPMIPFFLQGVAGVPELNNSDLIHPNAKGYAHIVKHNIYPALKPYLQD